MIKYKYNKKHLILYGTLALLFLAAVVLTLEKTRTTDFITDPFYQPAQPDINTSESDPTLKQKSPATTDPKLDTVDTSKNTSQVPTSSSSVITIDSVEQTNGLITYSATITNPATEGTCSAIFTKPNSKPVSRVFNTKSAMCGPVSIPELEFESLGSWLMTIRYYANDSQSVDTKSVEVR